MHLNCFGSSIVPEQKQWHRYIMRKQDAAFCTNGSRLTPTDCRTETEMGPIVLSGRDISNLLPKVARTGRELLGIAFVKPAAKNLGLKPFIPCCFCNICCLSWRNDIWFEMCFLGDGDFAHGGPWGKCSRKEFDLVYQRLNIQGLQERNALWLGMASVGLTGNCTQHIQKISKVVRFIMINIRCTQNQKGVSNHKLLQLQSCNQEKDSKCKRCKNLLRHCLQLYRISWVSLDCQTSPLPARSEESPFTTTCCQMWWRICRGKQDEVIAAYSSCKRIAKGWVSNMSSLFQPRPTTPSKFGAGMSM